MNTGMVNGYLFEQIHVEELPSNLVIEVKRKLPVCDRIITFAAYNRSSNLYYLHMNDGNTKNCYGSMWSQDGYRYVTVRHRNKKTTNLMMKYLSSFAHLHIKG